MASFFVDRELGRGKGGMWESEGPLSIRRVALYGDRRQLAYTCHRGVAGVAPNSPTIGPIDPANGAMTRKRPET